MSISTAKLQEVIDSVMRLLKLRNRETDANWNGATLPLVFRAKKESVDILLKAHEYPVVHDGEASPCSLIISSKATCDWKGAIEFYIFERHLPYLAGFVADLLTLREYRRINDMLLKMTMEHRKIAIVTSTIEIKAQKK